MMKKIKRTALVVGAGPGGSTVAYYLAKLAGFQNVSCKGGHGLFALLPQYYTREFFAFVKELLFTRSA